MAQNKLENQIKEQLDSREIQPSAQAWDRLDAMLTIAEEKKTKRSFGWLYIAASVAVLLIAGMLFFSQESTEVNTQNNVVGTEVKKDAIQNDKNQIAPITEKAQENQVAVSETENRNQQNTNNNQRVSINQNQSSSNQKQSSNPLINREKEIEFQGSSDIAIKDLPKTVDSKPIVVYNRPKNAITPSDEELLAGLDNSAKKSTSQKSTVSIDAKSLLSQVDGELEMTFREKVITKVAKNYKEVKVALANRNNE